MHGKTSIITTTQEGVFANLPRQFTVNRYHSLGDQARQLPRCSRSPPGPTTARSWACGHRELAIQGVQFHPESILTEHGHAMLKELLDQA